MVGISVAAEDISPRSAARHGPTGPPGAAPRAALAVAPVALALVLLSIAVLSNGAFALRQWGPIAFFALVTLAFAPRDRLRGAGDWRSSSRCGRFALWSLLSVTWADAPGRGGRGRAGATCSTPRSSASRSLTLPGPRARRCGWRGR